MYWLVVYRFQYFVLFCFVCFWYIYSKMSGPRETIVISSWHMWMSYLPYETWHSWEQGFLLIQYYISVLHAWLRSGNKTFSTLILWNETWIEEMQLDRMRWKIRKGSTVGRKKEWGKILSSVTSWSRTQAKIHATPDSTDILLLHQV